MDLMEVPKEAVSDTVVKGVEDFKREVEMQASSSVGRVNEHVVNVDQLDIKLHHLWRKEKLNAETAITVVATLLAAFALADLKNLYKVDSADFDICGEDIGRTLLLSHVIMLSIVAIVSFYTILYTTWQHWGGMKILHPDRGYTSAAVGDFDFW